MRLVHPHACRGSRPPGAVTVAGEDYAVDADGVVDVPEHAAETLIDAWADRFGVDREALTPEADTDAPPAPLGGDAAAMIDAGECPWCSAYEGDAVAQHAASAHPDLWAAHKNDLETEQEQED
jgi:hypothetical protein